MTPYIFAGAGFFTITLLLAWYITGSGLKPSQHFSIGFRAMAISYLVGAAVLFFLAARLS
jgi:hypothetical protein